MVWRDNPYISAEENRRRWAARRASALHKKKFYKRHMKWQASFLNKRKGFRRYGDAFPIWLMLEKIKRESPTARRYLKSL